LISTKQFDYHLPAELIAQHPSDDRAASRLMHLTRSDGKINHRTFADIVELLQPGDLLIVNNTRVIPARFYCRRESGAQIEGLFVKYLADNCWEVMLKNATRCKEGETVFFRNDELQGLRLMQRLGQGLWKVLPQPAGLAEEILDRLGRTPLPPYIHREQLSPDEEDRDRYQTVFARTPGAVAAPTAGLHFTQKLLEKLQARGISMADVTLHVGLGTFLPVKVDDASKHEMHSEWYEISAQTAEAIGSAKRDGRRVIAIGTTSVRVLESVTRRFDKKIQPCSGETKLFLYPSAEFYAVDAMITNFHLPQSTLLMLVAAFCCPGGNKGIQMILDAYAQAVQQQYRFFSYGDAMFIE